MLDMLWQLGVLSAVIIFGVKIGMAMGFAGLTKKQVLLIASINAICIIILSKLCEPYTDLLYQVINQYSYILFGIMAIIILITGIHTVKEWKTNHKSHATATCMALVVPCPCCIAAILGSIIISAPIISLSTLLLGTLSALLLVLVMVVVYFLSEKIVEKINKPFPIVLGNFMIFVGLYFLIAMSILPNLSKALLDNYDSFSIGVPYDLLKVFAVLALVVIIAYFIKSKSNYLN